MDRSATLENTEATTIATAKEDTFATLHDYEISLPGADGSRRWLDQCDGFFE